MNLIVHRLFLLLCFLLSNTVSIADETNSKHPRTVFPSLDYISEHYHLKVELIASGYGIPWGMTFLNNKELLITSRSGQLHLFNLNSKSSQTIKGVPSVFSKGQGGLLDVKASPDYQQTGYIYFTYAKEVNGRGATTLARAKIKQNRISQWQDLLVTDSATDETYHFGSRIAFDKAGHLYFGIGDRGVRPNAQTLANHAGSILRLNLDGSVPDDNPFINKKDVRPEIWSYGHRNPQGLTYDSQNNRLWEIEHGPRGGDEINLIEPGKNYGWPVISYGKEYWGPLQVGEGTHKQGMEQPVKYYVPSIAPGSLIVYNGDMFPLWKGNLLSGALKLQHINRVVMQGNRAVAEERLLKGLNQRIRNLVEGPAGAIYFSTDNGHIYKMTPLK